MILLDTGPLAREALTCFERVASRHLQSDNWSFFVSGFASLLSIGLHHSFMFLHTTQEEGYGNWDRRTKRFQATRMIFRACNRDF